MKLTFHITDKALRGNFGLNSSHETGRHIVHIKILHMIAHNLFLSANLWSEFLSLCIILYARFVTT
jgi:hypothetical protein